MSMPLAWLPGHRSKSLAGLAVALIILLTAPTGLATRGPRGASAATYVEVSEILPTLFNPQLVTVNVGDIVCWVSLVGDHTSTAFLGQAEYWNSGDFNDGATYCHTFTHVGNFTYFSDFPEDKGAVGAVLVQQPVPEYPGSILWLMIAGCVGMAAVVSRSFEKRLERTSSLPSDAK